jgi:hypothetical protein
VAWWWRESAHQQRLGMARDVLALDALQDR